MKANLKTLKAWLEQEISECQKDLETYELSRKNTVFETDKEGYKELIDIVTGKIRAYKEVLGKLDEQEKELRELLKNPKFYELSPPHPLLIIQEVLGE
jgi:hypothetical protein